MTDADDARYLREAIDLARQGMEAGAGGPFGAVVVRDGEVIGRGHNEVLRRHDPTAHAEVVAIRAACERVGDHHLTGSVLYASCEPCPLCFGAAAWARVERILYACTASDAAAIGFDDAAFHEELRRPPEERELPMVNLLRDEGLVVFDAWRERPDSQLY